MITITISKKELHTSAVGYQPPLPADQVKPAPEFNYDGDESPTNRGRGRGGRGRGRPRAVAGNDFSEYEDGGWDRPRGSGRSRGRGRCHNLHDRGRGGCNSGPHMDT